MIPTPTEFEIDEVAILGEFTDQRIDLPESQLWAALEITTHEAILRHTDLDSRGTSIFKGRRAVFLGQREDPQDAANARLTLSLIDGHRQYANLPSGVARTAQQLRGAQGHFLWVVLALDAIPAAFLANVFAEKHLEPDHTEQRRRSDAHVPVPKLSAPIGNQVKIT